MLEEQWQRAWYEQLVWSPPHSIAEIIDGNLPRGAGLYVFTRDRATLSSHQYTLCRQGRWRQANIENPDLYVPEPLPKR